MNRIVALPLLAVVLAASACRPSGGAPQPTAEAKTEAGGHEGHGEGKEADDHGGHGSTKVSDLDRPADERAAALQALVRARANPAPAGA